MIQAGIYHNIVGWFDYESVYDKLINEIPDNSRFVEVGCFIGKSTAYLTEKAVNSGKKINIDVVDSFVVRIEEKWPWSGPPNQKECFYWNMERLGLRRHINVHELDSITASNQFGGETIDCVFLDGDHEYNYLIGEIQSWLPRIKSGGYLCGHDYGDVHPGVKQAVDSLLGKENIELIGHPEYSQPSYCWIYKKPQHGT